MTATVFMVQRQSEFSLMMTPRKSPGLLIRQIDGAHHYAVNTLHPHSLRILTPEQSAILNLVDGKATIEDLSDQVSVDTRSLADFLTLLSRTELVSLGPEFTVPGKPDVPSELNFWIHTTNKCNLSCGYCYISTLQTTGGMSAEVRNQLIKKLVDTASTRGITDMKLRFAGGEPLLQFRAWRHLIEETQMQLDRIGCRLSVSFLTNLTVLTEDVIAFAKDNRVRFGVSLDGPAPEHDAVRTLRSGGGTFTVVDNNIKKLLANDIRISVNTVLTDSNLDGLPELTRYLIALDIPFRYSIVKGNPINPFLLEERLNEAYELMEEAIEAGWRFSQRHQFCDLKPMELGFQTCSSGFSGGAIYVDGTVKYCHVHFGDDHQKSFSIFDESLDLMEMIDRGEHLEDDRSDDCRKCKYRAVCTSGCPVYRVGQKDPQCSIYHKFIPKIYDLHAKERLKLLRTYKII